MALVEYRRKRHFERTPEPRGKQAPRGRTLSFVIHQHAASHLHYDFRLELDGVLKSWAVPKGPSLDPEHKRLAVEVEDHPLEYGTFEGVIPKGEYGAGEVIVWDRGTWIPRGDPHAGLAKGHLAFELRGTKLEGGWALLRMGGRAAAQASKPQWLLVKERDAAARAGAKAAITESRPESVASGRTIADLKRAPVGARDEWRRSAAHALRPGDPAHSANGHAGNGRSAVTRHTAGRAHRHAVSGRSAGPREAPSRSSKTLQAPKASKGRTRVSRERADLDLKRIPGARRGALPANTAPELATLVSAAPVGDAWLHEIKFDGYRLACRIDRDQVQLLTRTGQDWTERFEAVAEACRGLPVRSALLDGEVVVLRPDGITDFQALQNLMGRGGQGRLTLFAFDLLHLDGWDLTRAPLEQRKQALAGVLAGDPTGGVVRYSDHVIGEGERFRDAACRRGLEGILSKRRDSLYVARRTRDWLKIKCGTRQEFVIGGFTEPKGARRGLGALLIGVREPDGTLRYCGKVGTGFTADSLSTLARRLGRLEVRRPAFARPPRMRDVHWVRPELVAEVAFTGWTTEGRARHPSFQGLREDRPAPEVVEERPAARSRPAPARARRTAAPHSKTSRPARDGAPPAFSGVTITHPDRVLDREQGLTKLELARYMEAVAPRMLREVANRPLMIKRCPEGVAGACFYQKHPSGREPDVIGKVEIRESKQESEYLVVKDAAGLAALVQMGALEIHVWGSRADRVEQPDRLVFDLDPDPSTPWSEVVETARAVRRHLEELDLESFVKTTGGRGLHVLAPIHRGAEWDRVKELSAAIGLALVREAPDRLTTQLSKSRRGGRLFVDTLRNGRGATWVAPYSPRARDGVPVSWPLDWRDLTPRLDPAAFTVTALLRDSRRLARDAWGVLPATRQTLTDAMLRRAQARARMNCGAPSPSRD